MTDDVTQMIARVRELERDRAALATRPEADDPDCTLELMRQLGRISSETAYFAPALAAACERLGAASRENARLMKLLSNIEFAGVSVGSDGIPHPYCLCCGQSDTSDHLPDCALDAVLKEHEAATESEASR